MVKALILIDMIQAYSKDIYADKKIVEHQRSLIHAFKKKKLPVIVALPSVKKQKKNPIMLYLWGDELKGDNKRKQGYKLRDLIPELQTVQWDKIVHKSEYSAFFRTDLESYCKTKKITELYFCGIYSGVCVQYSGVDAAYRHIWPILVTDASTTFKKKLHVVNCKRFAETIGKVTSTKKVLHSL
jgi:isochorismate hydrolase